MSYGPIMLALIGLTEIEAIPVWIADIWRVVLWFAMVALVAYYPPVLLAAWRDEEATWRRASLYGTTALAIFMLNGVFITAGRLHQPMVAEGTPILTVAVILAYKSARCLAAEYGHHRPFDRRS